MSRTKSGIDPEIIRELANLLTETDLTEIEVQQADLRIRVARQINVTATVPVSAPAAGVAVPVTAVAIPAASPSPPADPSSHPGVLKSPMVGTAYLGASPGAKPFVEVGSKVNQGERVMIVEAMKTVNDITAAKSGTVTAIFIEDKQPVEYGQPLMIIE